MSRHVMIASDVGDPTQNGRMRAPTVPEELDHRDDDRENDARNRTEDRDAAEANHREPELPTLDAIDA